MAPLWLQTELHEITSQVHAGGWVLASNVSAGACSRRRHTCAELHKGKFLLVVDVDVHHTQPCAQAGQRAMLEGGNAELLSRSCQRRQLHTAELAQCSDRLVAVRAQKVGCCRTCSRYSGCTVVQCQGRVQHRMYSDHADEGGPGPAVVPPTAARALEKKVAMFCSLAVGGSPPT